MPLSAPKRHTPVVWSQRLIGVLVELTKYHYLSADKKESRSVRLHMKRFEHTQMNILDLRMSRKTFTHVTLVTEVYKKAEQ